MRDHTKYVNKVHLLILDPVMLNCMIAV
uniref:Uncharacterized protein n=1 Tax=Anguilla anguilla TaxID=7936 RepID=A0A0E9U0C1_ANGAN